MLVPRIIVTLSAIVLATGALPTSARSQNDLCANPTFRIPDGSPFQVRPKPGIGFDPTALTAGTYIARADMQVGCGCDLAVAVTSRSNPPEGFVALMRGNENGTFTIDPGALLGIDANPVAMASGRFRQNVNFDGIVAVTALPGQNGRAHVFVPDAQGGYRPPQAGPGIFATGPDPVAIATGDFNGDGRIDVAIANMGNNSLTILLGTGTGTFAPNIVTVPNLGGIPESITAGKFSGSSGPDDIAVSVLENVAGSARVGIVIVQGSNAGTFAPKPVIPVGQLNSRGSLIAAANLSGPSEGTAGRRFRDVAIAFMDRTAAGAPIGRVKVLLGQDRGGFSTVAAQTHDFGALPRSIKVADLDDDGVVDLIVSTFGDLASQSDGTIRFFKGSAAPTPNVGFNVNASWFTIPATTGVRPRALVAGRFGRNSPGEPPASMGVAAINAPSLSSVSVFLGNGQGAFVQPTQVTTLLGPDDRLFVAGDFHSTDGNSPLMDLAFVTKMSDRNVLAVLQSNGAGGFERTFGRRLMLAGNTPRLIAGGRFTSTGPLAIAIVDETGALGAQPLLKVLFGEGNGSFKSGTELVLSQAGRPRAIATGPFRGAGMPIDIAIAGDTTLPGSSTANGKLTILFNDGNGRFTVGRTHELGFVPGSMVASSRLRPDGKTDLLIRDAHADRFLFLVNIDNGDFRPAGVSSGAGNVDALLVGDVATRSPSDGLDDVVTFDRDMTLRVFVNTGLESFNLRVVNPPDHPNFRGARPPYVLADFGGGKLGLAAPVVRDRRIGLALLQGNGEGGFTVATGEVPLRPLTQLAATSKTEFGLPPAPELFRVNETLFLQGMAAQFRSALHGNRKPDLGFAYAATERSLVSGMCATDPQPFPPPIFHEQVCKTTHPGTIACREQGKPPDCSETECHTRPPTPFQAFCRTVQPFSPALTVYGNTCGD
jgi:VCBS repeat protein